MRSSKLATVNQISWPGVVIQNVSNQLVHGINTSNFVPPNLIFRELKTYVAVQMSL